MSQPRIGDVEHSSRAALFGSTGTEWIAALIDTLGHLQVDVLSAALGSGGATEATLLLIKGYVDTLETLLAGGLPAALDSGALKTKEQSPLTGFATSANQAIIAGYIDTLETLLAGGLPAALDSGALKTKEQSPLTGFATSANQTTMITALQLIDDLRNALGSVNTDDLQVDVKTYPGVNALLNIPFGYNDRYSQQIAAVSTGAPTTFAYGTPVPVGEVWCIESATMRHDDPTTRVADLGAYDGINYSTLARNVALATYIFLFWVGKVTLKAGDKVYFRVDGLLSGKGVIGVAWGYKMKVA